MLCLPVVEVLVSLTGSQSLHFLCGLEGSMYCKREWCLFASVHHCPLAPVARHHPFLLSWLWRAEIEEEKKQSSPNTSMIEEICTVIMPIVLHHVMKQEWWWIIHESCKPAIEVLSCRLLVAHSLSTQSCENSRSTLLVGEQAEVFLSSAESQDHYSNGWQTMMLDCAGGFAGTTRICKRMHRKGIQQWNYGAISRV